MTSPSVYRPELVTSVPEFYYELPPELIAQEPTRPRDHAIMFVLDRRSGERVERTVRDLPDYVHPGDTVVVNNTRVMPTVLRGQRIGGAQISIKLVSRKTDAIWDCAIDSTRGLSDGERLVFGDGALVGEVLRRNPQGSGTLITFSCPDGDLTNTIGRFAKYFHPLHLPAVQPGGEDILQTVYARDSGSFQSPSAGLHMTAELLDAVREKGADVVEVTQHVGRLDRPDLITGARALQEHTLYEERYEVTAQAAERINAARGRGCRVIAIGTTVTRTLETVADEDGTVRADDGWTTLFIKPGYRFRAVDALLSNFQSPLITTLIMACAFAGTEQVMEHYREAVRRGYRFLEYGDAALYM